MTKSFKKTIMKGNGCGFSRTKKNSPECSIKNNPIITADNISSKPKLKSALKSKSYTRKKIPVTFSPNTKSNSVSAIPTQKKKKRYTSMKKQIQIDKANARLNFKSKAQQLQEDIQQLKDEKLKKVTV